MRNCSKLAATFWRIWRGFQKREEVLLILATAALCTSSGTGTAQGQGDFLPFSPFFPWQSMSHPEQEAEGLIPPSCPAQNSLKEPGNRIHPSHHLVLNILDNLAPTPSSPVDSKLELWGVAGIIPPLLMKYFTGYQALTNVLLGLSFPICALLN